jgi:hypothetical protein
MAPDTDAFPVRKYQFAGMGLDALNLVTQEKNPKIRRAIVSRDEDLTERWAEFKAVRREECRRLWSRVQPASDSEEVLEEEEY